MDTKQLTTTATLKADDNGEEGTIEAVFSTFGVVDRDGDIVEAGAIQNNVNVPMVWSHDWTKMIGRGVTHTTSERAVYKGKFFLDTEAGADAYRTVKAMGDLMQYSWGFRILEGDWVEKDGDYVRVIKRAELFEVSPVLIGAGLDTGTLGLKHGQPLNEQLDIIENAITDLVARVKSRVDYRLSGNDNRAKEGRALSTANRERLQNIAEALAGASGDLKAILKDTEPAKSYDADALFWEYQQLLASFNGVIA
jgi:HK97 family phage prohead protease